MKKRLLIICFLFTIGLETIFGIGFGFHIFETRTNMDFAEGVYPTSLLYQFNFPVPDIKQGYRTEFNFRIDNGIDFRNLRQTPNEGIPYSSNPDKEEWNYTKSYLTFFDEMNFVFGQGFFRNPLSNNNLLTLWATIDLRFEYSYERFKYLYDQTELDGLFYKVPKTNNHDAEERFPGSTWIGQPELAGNRQSQNLSISIGFDINIMEDKITRRNGLKYSFLTRLAPNAFSKILNDSHEFYLFWNQLNLSFTPLSVKMNGKRDTTWFSIVLDNTTTYRYITGQRIPYYIQGGHIYGSQALNTEHLITNKTSITFYGPQINSYDCYPSLTAFVEYGISMGNLLNSIDKTYYEDTIASIGIKAEFRIFDIAKFYYETGYVIYNTLNEKSGTVTHMGFTLGI